MRGSSPNVNSRRDLLFSVAMLGIIVSFALIGLATDHNWPKMLRVTLSFSAYAGLLITLCRIEGYHLRWRWFVASSILAGIVSGIVRPEFHVSTLIAGTVAGGLLLGSAHWLALTRWRKLLPASHAVLPFVAMLFLLTAACAPTDKPQTAAQDSAAAATPAPDTIWAGPKACDLVAADQISKVTGAEYKAGTTTNDYAGDSQCRFERADTSKAYIMVTLHGHGRIEPYRGVPNTSEVSGLGDAAYWNEDNAQLAVKHGASVFSIGFLPPPAKKAWALALARTALSKFPGGK